MTNKRFFVGMLLLVGILITGIIYSTLSASRMIQSKGDELVGLKVSQATLDERETSLDQAAKDIKNYAELVKIAQSIVPQEKDQARTVREIVAIADNTGIQLAAITFPTSGLGEAKQKGKTSAKNPQLSDPATSQLTQVEGTTGLYALPITIDSTDAAIPYARLLDFLRGLEQNRRTAHVTSITVQPSEDNRNLVTFSLGLNVYIKL